MLEALAKAIRDQDKDVVGIFEDGFQTPTQWRDFIQTSYGAKPDVTSILNAAAGDKATSEKRFHALFIACWLFYPVEKGSFMLNLEGAAQQQNILSGKALLDKRWSSHLGDKDPRSAGRGFAFLTGYHELLVQIEDGNTYLFVKAEGHGAASVAHLSSFFTKWKTGKGNTASAALNNLAKDHQEFGIAPRAAENYGKSYEKLLEKKLDLKGKTVTIEDALGAMVEKCKKDDDATFKNKVAGAGLDRNLKDASGLGPGDQAKLLENVIIPFSETLGPKSKFAGRIKDAKEDLLGIVKMLKMDAANGVSGPRYFQELRLRPSHLNNALQAFLDVLG
jgi:hypothetical protein